MSGARMMRRAVIAIAAAASMMFGAVHAETVLTVTQTNYDYLNHPVCTAVRMNSAVYGSLPSDACTLGTPSATFGNDRITRTFYDAAGQAVQVVQAYGTSDSRVYSTISYGNDGEVIDTIDANGNRSHGVYDGLNRLITFNYPSTTRPTSYDPSTYALALSTAGAYSTTDYEAYTYDANDNRVTTRRRDAVVFQDCYDNLNRVIIHYLHNPGNCTATGGAADVYTVYDGLGRITDKHFSSFTGTQKVTYAYDGLSRVTSTTDMNGRTVAYQYNAASAATRTTYHDGSYVNWGLDNANRVKSPTHSSSTSLYSLVYNSLGQRVSLTYASSNSVGYTYDPVGRLATFNDNLTGTTNDITWTFSYNPASQVSSWSASSAVYDYKEYATSTVNQTYDGLNRDAAIASVTGGYDARGNMTKDATRAMTYDLENRFVTSAPVGTPGSPNTTLAYDPEGRLATYTDVTGGVTHVTDFEYDGTDIIAEYDHSSGAVLRSYVHAPGADEPVVWFEGSGTTSKHFLVPNYQSSIIATTDSGGNLENTYEYGAYGEPETNKANPATTNPWIGPRFRYTGQTMLFGASLYYYKARVYDPIYGHFLQTDPIGSKDDLDLYAYTGNDPVNKVDTSGKTAYCYENPDGSATCEIQCNSILTCAGDAITVAIYAAGRNANPPDRRDRTPISTNDSSDASSSSSESSGSSSGEAGETQSKPPAGSKPINETDWSGDHQEIKSGVGAGPKDNVKISPSGDVWVQNPDGSWTNAGSAGDYTGSGEPKGRRGKDRDQDRDQQRGRGKGRDDYGGRGSRGRRRDYDDF